MGFRETCPNCKKTHRYSSDEVENIGTIARHIPSVICPNCGYQIVGKESRIFPKNKDLNLQYDREGKIFNYQSKDWKEDYKGNVYERIERQTILEYWAQSFFFECYKEYGFSQIKGPFKSGPDFTTVEKKKTVGIEIEKDWKKYIEHKHHLNGNFSTVKYLIVLRKKDIPKEARKFLPKEILFIDTKRFVPWFRNKCKEYSEAKKKERKGKQLGILLNFIAGEFLRRYVDVCPDTEKDMAICPDCENCAYKPDIDFNKWAIDFIVKYDYPIYDQEFSLSEIDPQKVNGFFNKKMNR